MLDNNYMCLVKYKNGGGKIGRSGNVLKYAIIMKVGKSTCKELFLHAIEIYIYIKVLVAITKTILFKQRSTSLYACTH